MKFKTETPSELPHQFNVANQPVMRARVWLATALITSVALFSNGKIAIAQDENAGKTTDSVAATVGDHKIYVSQIDHEFHKTFAQRNIDTATRNRLRTEILNQLCDQQLILHRLAKSDVYGNDDEVDLEVSRLKERLAAIEKPLETYLQENHQSLAGLRFNLRWQISWKRYLESVLTDETLEKYFNRHRRQFDGTQLKVSHILLEIPKDGKEDATAKPVIDSANELRKKIESGETTWQATAAANSTAPSSDKAGHVGWIDYTGPMSRSFTEAAFQLEVGNISPPTETPFGIHLIRCDEIKPGTIPWYDAKTAIRGVATRELFQRLSNKQRTLTEVRQ